MRRGQRNDVVLDVGGWCRTALPAYGAALADLELSAARVVAAGRVGLPAPVVLDVVPGPLGDAHLVLTLVGGVGLSPRSPPASTRRAGSAWSPTWSRCWDCCGRADAVEWPGDPLPWAERWAELGTRLRHEVVPLIGADAGTRQAVRQIAAAEAAAGAAGDRGLTHGDLGGENVHVDPVTGAVLGVLDWDDAAPGDPAVDLAAVRVHAEPWLAAALLAADPSLLELVARAEAYVGTFALQQALWGVESGDADEVRDGLESATGR